MMEFSVSTHGPIGVKSGKENQIISQQAYLVGLMNNLFAKIDCRTEMQCKCLRLINAESIMFVNMRSAGVTMVQSIRMV